MSQDIVSDILNGIMNAKRAGKSEILANRSSKLLIQVLKMMQQYGYLDYDLIDGKLKITLKELNECRAIKPRYAVNIKNMEKYVRRFLPARNFGFVIISTSKGLMTHQEAKENKIGGSIIAYFY